MGITQNEQGHVELGFPVEDTETQTQLTQIAMMAAAIPAEDLDSLYASYQQVHTLGIFDPTAYMRAMGPLEQRQKLAAAFISFHREAVAFRDAVMGASS